MPRHRWSDPVRFERKTERECVKCGIMKVTKHEPGERPWVEFYRGLDRIEGKGTPVCEASRETELAGASG